MTDYRTRSGVEHSILQEVYNNGEINKTWLYANQNRPAALERLLARGEIHPLPVKHPSVLRFALGPRKVSVVKRLLRWMN